MIKPRLNTRKPNKARAMKRELLANERCPEWVKKHIEFLGTLQPVDAEGWSRTIALLQSKRADEQTANYKEL